MAKIKLYAKSCQFNDCSFGRSMSYFPFDADIASKNVELSKVADIMAAKAEMAEQLKAERPGESFFVSAMLMRGERAPNGFKKMQPLNFDAGLVLEAA
jgi:hypothetical protein